MTSIDPGTLGPIASRPDLIGKGVGAPLLVGALASTCGRRVAT